MTTAAFSNDGSEVIRREVEAPPDVKVTPADLLEEVYQLQGCADWITSQGFKQVALQFPDELLCDSMAIAKLLRDQAQTKVFILGDTSYGSCCVDEVAAEHQDADSVIHFGHTCLSPTRRLPVRYVYGRWAVDVDHCAQSMSALIKDELGPALLVYDLHYHYAADQLAEKLKERVTGDLVVARPASCDKDSTSNNTNTTMLGWTFKLAENQKLSDFKILYIGSEGRQLTNWMMNLTQNTFLSYDPQTQFSRKENGVNKQVMRRYFMIEKAKDAQIVGILVGTLGVADYLSVIDQLKDVVKKAGKKTYTFVVGKLNVAKLANFMEVDVYVLVACPENTLIDSGEFYRPVVTPYEMEMACNPARQWTGEYVTDFRQLLPGASLYVEPPVESVCEADVSLVTGHIRRMGLESEDDTDVGTGTLAEQKPMTVGVIHSAADKLAERTWQGLEQKLGQTPVTKATEGRKGIAMGYKEEPQQL